MTTAETFLTQYTDVEPLPHVITTVTSLINDPESTIKDFEEVIMMDLSLVKRLLTLVNSPYYGLTQTVDSIGRAVAFLGMKNLNSLIVVDAIKTMFKKEGERKGFDRKELWLHSAMVSICSKLVAERIFGVNGDDAFLCGILHDFGLLVEDQIKPAEFADILSQAATTDALVAGEQAAFATNHCEIGYQMTLGWKMSERVQTAIRDHHLITEEIEPTSLTGILQIAEYLSGQLQQPLLAGVQTVIAPSLMAHLEENANEYAVLVEDLPGELEKAQTIYG